MILKAELEKLGLNYSQLELGEVEIKGSITEEQLLEIVAIIGKSLTILENL